MYLHFPPSNWVKVSNLHQFILSAKISMLQFPIKSDLASGTGATNLEFFQDVSLCGKAGGLIV